MKRKAITDKMKWQALMWWCEPRCPECGEPILWPTEDIEWDHRQALVHAGAHEAANLRPVHAFCHARKTARDVKANCKVKRLRGETKQKNGPKIKTRGFNKTLRKRMGGTVERRVP